MTTFQQAQSGGETTISDRGRLAGKKNVVYDNEDVTSTEKKGKDNKKSGLIKLDRRTWHQCILIPSRIHWITNITRYEEAHLALKW